MFTCKFEWGGMDFAETVASLPPGATVLYANNNGCDQDTYVVQFADWASCRALVVEEIEAYTAGDPLTPAELDNAVMAYALTHARYAGGADAPADAGAMPTTRGNMYPEELVA